MVPCSITGTWLCDHVNEYHWQNPRQLAAQMLFEVATARAVSALLNDVVGHTYISYPALNISTSPSVWPARTYALKQQLPPCPKVVITNQPSHRHGHTGQGENAGGANSGENPEGQDTELPLSVTEAPPIAKRDK